jgi:hypothetical protein
MPMGVGVRKWSGFDSRRIPCRLVSSIPLRRTAYKKGRCIMDVTVKGGKMTIVIDIQDAKVSATGKTMVVVSTGGFKDAGVKVDGKPVRLNITGTIPNK